MLEPSQQIQSTALIAYTSGSTSRPKGVMHSQQQLLANSQSIIDFFQLNSDIKSLSAGLDFNGMLSSIILTTLFIGGTAVISEAKNAVETLDEICEHKINMLFQIPSYYFDLIKAAQLKTLKTTALRFCFMGGDTSTPILFEKFYHAFHLQLISAMGMTETLFQSSMLENDTHPIGSAGKPLPGVVFKIIDPDTQKDLPSNQPGELLIQSAALTLGYWKNIAATKEAIQSGWLYSGDIGYLDEKGYFWFLSRRKNIVVIQGNNIAPSEVEKVLCQYPFVEMAVVIGYAIDQQDNALCAFITEKKAGAVIVKDLLTYASSQLADYKVPSKVYVLDQLPRNARHKIDRTALKNLLDNDH